MLVSNCKYPFVSSDKFTHKCIYLLDHYCCYFASLSNLDSVFGDLEFYAMERSGGEEASE